METLVTKAIVVISFEILVCPRLFFKAGEDELVHQGEFLTEHETLMPHATITILFKTSIDPRLPNSELYNSRTFPQCVLVVSSRINKVFRPYKAIPHAGIVLVDSDSFFLYVFEPSQDNSYFCWYRVHPQYYHLRF